MNTLHKITNRLATLSAAGILMIATATQAKEDVSPIHDVITAHGGLETWNSYAAFTYTMEGFPLSEQVAQTNTSRVNLRTRNNRVEGPDWTVGFDGESAWSVPHKDAAGLPTRFFTLGSFYFIGMPYVFADPGISVAEIEPQTFRGREYRVLTVSYNDGVGHSDKDDYHLFIDPETDQLALIHHSVTETGIERVTWTFDAWQETDGLLVPETMTFYPGWNPEDPGDGATFQVSNTSFSTTEPDATIYQPPSNSAISN